jgi:hypothetical protein
MAKEKEEGESRRTREREGGDKEGRGEHESKKEREGEGGKGKKKKLHLREIRSEQAHDGSIVHHHTYADHKEAPFSHPERKNMATSSSPEEAGQHVAEQFAQNGGEQGGEAAEGSEAEPEPGESEGGIAQPMG